MLFVNPKNGVAFKKIFGNEQHKEILISFLNAVLNLHGVHEIADLTILNPYQAPKLAELKYTLLDVRAIDKRGVTFIVEMQIEWTSLACRWDGASAGHEIHRIERRRSECLAR